MTVKIVYLNGYFEYVRNVENIYADNIWFVLKLRGGTIKKNQVIHLKWVIVALIIYVPIFAKYLTKNLEKCMQILCLR